MSTEYAYSGQADLEEAEAEFAASLWRMEDLLAALRSQGVQIAKEHLFAEHSGGGCATVYAGRYNEEEGTYPVLIGPGWFDTHGAATFTWDETCVGDCYGEDTETPTNMADLVTHLLAYLRKLGHGEVIGSL